MEVLKLLGCVTLAVVLFFTCSIMGLNLVVSMTAAQLPFGQDQVRAWQLGTPMASGPIPVGSGGTPDPFASPPPGGGPNPNPGGGGTPGSASQGGAPWHISGAGQCEGGGPYSHAGTPAFVWPTQEHVLSGYDWMTMRVVNGTSQPHYGIDIRANQGAPIYAAAEGVITWSGWEGSAGYGNLIVIDHGDGWGSRYAHLSAIFVPCDDLVTAGQLIGESGNTGRSSGAHLHFEILGWYTNGAGRQWGTINPWCFLPGSPPGNC
jgi:murein DD-endopeptidase MepM/ murein hydrolase activator NlpD